jgi:hypothetical protein
LEADLTLVIVTDYDDDKSAGDDDDNDTDDNDYSSTATNHFSSCAPKADDQLRSFIYGIHLPIK